MKNGNLEIMAMPEHVPLQKASFKTGSHFQIGWAAFWEHVSGICPDFLIGSPALG